MSNKTASNTIPLVIVTDEHYVIHLAALLKSIELNHISGEHIDVYVIADGVKAKSQKKIEASVDAAMFSIHWVKMEDTIPPGVTLPLDRTSYPITIYLRLFIANIVPKATKKALFLDVDMIVLEDISKLYNHDLGDNVIAAVQDPRLLTFDNDWGGIFNYKELGFDAKTKYFNTGLIIFDMEKWVAGNYAQKIIDGINENIKFANYPDQYGFNIVLANKWLELDTKWNYFASGDEESPYLVHFISRKPFYTSYSYNPKYKELFYKYLKLTEWRNAKPIGEMDRYVKKLKNILVKIKKKVGLK
jgi:lipopolysaccharide biosynthesis glycosyltransferase